MGNRPINQRSRGPVVGPACTSRKQSACPAVDSTVLGGGPGMESVDTEQLAFHDGVNLRRGWVGFSKHETGVCSADA